MTERTSERIWRAARASYESRGQLKTFLPWDDLRQVSRDLEYDAMVAAVDAVDALWQMGAEEPSAPQQVVEAVAQSIFDRADRTDLAEARVRELEAETGRLHERLEDNHEFQLIDGKMTRVEVKPGSVPHGIECRDETIKLQDTRIVELEAALFTMDDAIALKRAEKAEARVRELEAEQTVIVERCIKAVWDAGGDNTEYHCDAIRSEVQSKTEPKAHTRIAELEAAGDDARACLNMLLLCGEEGGKRQAEKPAAYLRRLIDALIHAQAARNVDLEGDMLARKVDVLTAALKPFAEYAERIELEKEHPDRILLPMKARAPLPMAWFIAALKAYRGEGETSAPAPVLEKRPRAFLVTDPTGMPSMYMEEDVAQRQAEAWGVPYQGLYVRG